MSISIQTNVTSLIAQENLRVNNDFQNMTIQRLTSGYRINSSGDDAAGLAVANKFRADIAELMQGVRNANDGLSTLQIIDGGLNNISKIVNRLKTLATQSASDTFSGNRTILNTEYQSLLTEMNRQAADIGLGTGSTDAAKYNVSMNVYIGGGNVEANAKVAIDLSGSANKVDATSLGLNTTSVSGGGENALTGNSVDLSSGTFLSGTTQSFTFHFAGSDVTVAVGNGVSAITGAQAVEQLNNQLSAYGITASIISDATSADNGELQFSGGTKAFTVLAGNAVGGIVTNASTGRNQGMHYVANATAFGDVTAASEILTFVNDAGTTAVTLGNATTWTIDMALGTLNNSLNSEGIYATKNSAGTGIEFYSSSSFTLTASGTPTGGVFGADGAKTVVAPAAGATVTGNALAAITALSSAVTYLGSVQGKVGTAQNRLAYSIQLAQSQISSYSAAESRIRDADVASEAANLTKAQVLQQSSLAAMAQANATPQAVLALLRG
jgi:flagellin